jgi:type IV pilus assembly protein PilQ
MIEALVVDYNLDEMFEFGITASVGDSTMANHVDKWYPGVDVTASGPRINSLLKDIGSISLFGQQFNFGNLGNLPNDFYVNIRALEQDGLANVKSRPLLSTLNGHTAYLKIGTIQNYVFTDIMPIQNQLSSTYIEQERIQKIEAVISFEITPWVGPNEQLTLEIKPDFQTPVGEFSPDKNLIPSINTRTLESTVKLKDGETIVLGGLIQDIESKQISKFPFLGDIPLLGELFTNRKTKKTKSEMMIYITPRIFYEDEFGYAYYEYEE